MKRKIFRKNQIVAVEFLDHVEDGEEPLHFVIYGRIAKVDKKSIVIVSWCYLDPNLPLDSNNKYHTILKSAITNWNKLGIIT